MDAAVSATAYTPGHLSSLVDYVPESARSFPRHLPQILTSAFRSVGPSLVVNSPVALTQFPSLSRARINAPIPPVFQKVPLKTGAPVFRRPTSNPRDMASLSQALYLRITSSQGAQVSRGDRRPRKNGQEHDLMRDRLRVGICWAYPCLPRRASSFCAPFTESSWRPVQRRRSNESTGPNSTQHGVVNSEHATTYA